MSKFGEVVVKLEGSALEAARVQSRRMNAISMQIEELATSRADIEHSFWEGISEHSSLDMTRRHTFNVKTGEVTIDCGPGIDEDLL